MTGMKPTGDMLHLGNLLGALIPLQQKIEAKNATSDNYIFVADLHALTSVRDGKKLKEQTLEVAIDYMSVLGTSGVTFYKQSDMVQLPKLGWMLSNFTPYSLMLRAHSFKDKYQEIQDRENEQVFREGIVDGVARTLKSLQDQSAIKAGKEFQAYEKILREKLT